MGEGPERPRYASIQPVDPAVGVDLSVDRPGVDTCRLART